MASAADRVPPEIWEHILLQCDLTTEEAFRLQCVSQSFNRTINGSVPLLRLMDIAHRPIEEKKHRIPNPYIWTRYMEFRPFIYRYETLAPASLKNQSDRWNLNIHITLNLASPAQVAKSKLEFGPISNNRDLSHVLDGSWRRMLLSRFPIIINIPMRIQFLDVYYEETISDPTGTMTLGDLAETLTNVHSRTKPEHQALADVFKTTNTGQEVPVAKNGQFQIS